MLAALLGLLYKSLLLWMQAFPFNADEAIVALMARHMLEGNWTPFFYGQAYMGSFDASLVALGFALFGPQVWVIRGLQTLLYAGTLLTSVLLAGRITRSLEAGWIAGLLMAIPTVNVTLYTTVSIGGYGEALLLGNLLLILALEIDRRPERRWLTALWGFLAGLGFWIIGITLVWSIPSGLLILYRYSRPTARHLAAGALLPAALLGAIGAGPWLASLLREQGWQLLRELGGSAIAQPMGFWEAIGSRLLGLLLFGSTVIWGIRPPWAIEWLALPLAPLVVAGWIAAGWHAWKLLRRPSASPGYRLLALVILTLLLGFLATPFGADPSGRYFLPLTVPLVIFFAAWLTDLSAAPRLRWGLLALVMISHLWGTLQSARTQPPGITTQFDAITQVDHRHDEELIAFLQAQGEMHGYTNYWVAYPLAFKSQERLIFVPHLPYHQDFRYTSRDDRYPPYTRIVADSRRVAYITTFHPALDQRLREAFLKAGISWQEVRIGDYQVFYALSEALRPQALDPGWWDG